MQDLDLAKHSDANVLIETPSAVQSTKHNIVRTTTWWPTTNNKRVKPVRNETSTNSDDTKFVSTFSATLLYFNYTTLIVLSNSPLALCKIGWGNNMKGGTVRRKAYSTDKQICDTSKCEPQFGTASKLPKDTYVVCKKA